MVRVAGGLLQLEQPPGVIHQVLLVLRVHGVHLPVLAALVEQRAEEELGEPTWVNGTGSLNGTTLNDGGAGIHFKMRDDAKTFQHEKI